MSLMMAYVDSLAQRRLRLKLTLVHLLFGDFAEG